MDRVSQGNASVVTLAQTQTQHKKDYQKYFNYGATSQSKAGVNTKIKPYSRAKTVLISAYFVAGFLLALFIANFIIISSMQSELQISNQTYTEMVQQNEDYINAINEVTRQDSVEARMVEAGFVAGTTAVYEYANDYQSTESEEVQVQGNWYDRFVAFVSQIFGG